MALANFFGKNAIAASQILNGATPAAVGARLLEHSLIIAFDDAAAESMEGRVSLELLTNLAARLFPNLGFACLTSGAKPAQKLLRSLRALAREINPDVSLLGSTNGLTCAIVVGRTPMKHEASSRSFVTCIGSSKWWACVARDPVGSDNSDNPFGAAAAACIAVANVFRHVFATELLAPEADVRKALSVHDYTLIDLPPGGIEALPSSGSSPTGVDIGNTVLAGVGAIGNAAVWTLSRVTRLSGHLALVDHEAVTLSNLQRYLLTTQTHVATATLKAALAAQVIEQARNAGHISLRATPHPYLWGEYLRRQNDFHLERVATAFDNIPDRLAVQAALPRRIVNAWTQQGDLGVSRHPHFGVQPCLGCIYPMRTGGRSEAELVAEQMGIAEPAMDVRELLYSGAQVGDAFIRGVIGRRGITDSEVIEQLLLYADKSLRHLYQDVFCGGVILNIASDGGGPPIRAEAPMAFQSSLAGIMLAAEMLIDSGSLRSSTSPVRTSIDLLRPLSVYEPQVSRRNDGFCLCEDVDYLAAYQAKYG